MKFDSELVRAKIIKRYKRFLADVILENGDPLTVYCPNTGSMKNCVGENWDVALSKTDNPKRKYQYTLEMLHNGQCWIGVNTGLPNGLVEEAIKEGVISELSGYDQLKREVKYGKNSRIDILLCKNDSSGQESERCYVEVKNVTLVEEDGFYKFPDAVTARGTKHLEELESMVREGHRAVLVFTIQRSDGTTFKAADEIDPKYSKALKKAVKTGVEVLPYLVDVSPEGLQITKRVEYS